MQEGTQQEVKPILSKFSSKVEGLLDELSDVLGAFEHIAPVEGKLQALQPFKSWHAWLLQMLASKLFVHKGLQGLAPLACWPAHPETLLLCPFSRGLSLPTAPFVYIAELCLAACMDLYSDIFFQVLCMEAP